MTAPLLAVENLQKWFGGVHAVRGVSFEVRPGELLGLFGPNGAGKTTLFNLIAGAYKADRGRITLDGLDVTRLSAFRRAQAGIARTFQICRPFRSMSVADNVRAAAATNSQNRRDGREAVFAILQGVGLASRAGDPAPSLTLGMLKRLEVARALALQPKLFLLDEPLAGLSPGETDEFLAFIGTLKARASVILVDHNVRQSLRVCDRAIVLDAGAIISAGTPSQIRNDPRVRQAYLGETDA